MNLPFGNPTPAAKDRARDSRGASMWSWRTACFALAAVLALAWPLSRFGLACTIERPGVQTSLALVDRGLMLQRVSAPPPKPLDRDRYTIGLLSSAADPPSSLTLGAFSRAPGEFSLRVQVPPLLVVVLCAGVFFTLYPWARARRRAKRGLCPRCKYPRSPGDGACTECGVPLSEALQPTRPRWSMIARDALACGFVVVAALALSLCVCAVLDERAAKAHSAEVFDYSWYLEVTQPALTGAVTVVRPGENPLANTSPGTTVVLLPGRHQMGSGPRGGAGAALGDVWLLGFGPERTTLAVHIDKADAARIEGVTIECGDSPFCDLRAGGSLRLRNCRVNGYNSGAGGSNALFAAGSVLLVEDCEFEGRSGRAGASMRGDAFDLRAENRIFIRNTRFIDNDELFRHAEGVIDRCSITGDQPISAYPRGNPLYVRGSPFDVPAAAGSWIPFTQALDDFEVVDRLARGAPIARAMTDPAAKEVARAVDAGSADFWRRLLIHPDDRVRALAHAAAPLPPRDAPSTPPEIAIAQLDRATMPADAVLAILSAGDTARETLEAMSGTGSLRQRANAAALLYLMDEHPSFADSIATQHLQEGDRR